MEVRELKKIIEENYRGFPTKVSKIRKAELYYENKNDILRKRNPLADKVKDDPDNPLRNADNRVSHPWHQLLVNQKAAYTMSVPPLFDVDDKEVNQDIVKLLGDIYPKVAKDLCVNASNAGVGWLHVWIDNETTGDKGGYFKYAVVDSKQVIPVYSKKLGNELLGVLRVYEDYDEMYDTLTIFEYWTDVECCVVAKKKNASLDKLFEYSMFNVLDISTNEVIGQSNTFIHDWAEYKAVPFIPFRNNPSELSDLNMYKKLVDVYDKVYSGFINDIDDIQEVIFVLTNYGGEDKREFLNDLKEYKMVKVEADADEKSSVETLAIDIPIEARNKVLEITREAIFTHGQGVDPQRNIGQNNSGIALKYMYSLLELKASMLETEFRLGFAELVRFILRYYEKDADIKITQTWTRSSINNDLEQADVVAKLASVTSEENIAKANPLVGNWETEVANLQKERENISRMEDDYRDPTVEDVI